MCSPDCVGIVLYNVLTQQCGLSATGDGTLGTSMILTCVGLPRTRFSNDVRAHLHCMISLVPSSASISEPLNLHRAAHTMQVLFQSHLAIQVAQILLSMAQPGWNVENQTPGSSTTHQSRRYTTLVSHASAKACILSASCCCPWLASNCAQAAKRGGWGGSMSAPC